MTEPIKSLKNLVFFNICSNNNIDDIYTIVHQLKSIDYAGAARIVILNKRLSIEKESRIFIFIILFRI